MIAVTGLFPSYAALPGPHPRVAPGVTLVALASAERFAGLFTRCTAIAWGCRPVADAAERVALELVIRAVETTGTSDPFPRYTELLASPPPCLGIRLSLFLHHGLLVEVWDSDPNPPVPVDGAYLDTHLAIVQEISNRWNWYRRGGGKVIWAELRPPPPDPSARVFRPEPDEPLPPRHRLPLTPTAGRE